MDSSDHHGHLRQALLRAAEVALEVRGVQHLSLRELGVSHARELYQPGGPVLTLLNMPAAGNEQPRTAPLCPAVCRTGFAQKTKPR